MKKFVKRLAAGAAALGLVFGGTGLFKTDAGIFSDISASAVTTTEDGGSSDLPNVPSPTPDVEVEVQGRQFRLKWNRIYYVEKYGIAVYQSGKWRLKAQLDNDAVKFCYTSPKLQPGNVYHVRVCSKVNGKWCVNQSRSYKIIIGS